MFDGAGALCALARPPRVARPLARALAVGDGGVGVRLVPALGVGVGVGLLRAVGLGGAVGLGVGLATP
jgi:hypothetical protein